MFEKFSELSIGCIALSEEMARLLTSETIEDEHILLGLICKGSGTAAFSLKAFNLDYRKTLAEIERLSSNSISAPRSIVFGSRGAKVLEQAWSKSQNSNQTILTGHLLLAVIDTDALAAQALKNLGIGIPQLSEAVCEALGKPQLITAENDEIADSQIPRNLYEQFTPEMFLAMLLSEKEARSAGHGAVGSEHVLLGLMLIPNSRASEILREQNLTVEVLRSEIQAITGTGNGWMQRQLNLTPTARKVLLAAAQIASEAGQKIGVDQVLKAITDERKGIGFAVIEKFNLRFFIAVVFAFQFSTQAGLAVDAQSLGANFIQDKNYAGPLFNLTELISSIRISRRACP